MRLRLSIFGRIAHAGDIEPDLGGLQLREGEAQLRTRIVHLRAIFARVDFQKHIAFMDVDVVVDAETHHVPGNFGRDGNCIAVGVRIVGAFLIARHEPPDECADCKQHDNDGENDQWLFAARFAVFFAAAVGITVVRAIVFVIARFVVVIGARWFGAMIVARG